MDKLERYVAFTSAVLVLVFLSAIVFSAWFFKTSLPTCLTGVVGFTKGEVLPYYDPFRFKTGYEVHIIAKMWTFDPQVIEVEAGSKVQIYLTSLDVVHGFEIVGKSVNLMAVPGSINYAEVEFDEPGEYSIVCHEYCGIGHQNMAAKFVVTSTPHKSVPSETQELAKLDGHQLVQKKGCLGCHSLDGTRIVGPSFRALFGKDEQMEDGSTVRIDEQYIRHYIEEPNNKVVRGYQPLMPKLAVNDQEIQSIIQFLKTLK